MNSHAILTTSIWLKLRERIAFLENRVLEMSATQAASSPYRASDSSQTSIIAVKKELTQDATHPGLRQDCDHLHTTKRSFQKTRHAARRSSDKLKESDDNPYRMKLSHRYVDHFYSPYELHLQLKKEEAEEKKHCFTPPSPTNNNKKQMRLKNKACLFQHLCLICRSNHQEDNNDASSSSVSSRNGEARHPLVDCPVIKEKYWKGNYCLFFQREAGWCRAKDCIHVHKCLKCDSE
ncbi:hypothetical protein BDR26DRAFT_863923, partial [Obelidium mucronatum]